MTPITLIALIFLAAALISLWVYRTPWIWGTLLGIAVLLGIEAGMIQGTGCACLLALVSLWVAYSRGPNTFLFILLTLFSILLKMHFLPGFIPYSFTPKFAVGLAGPLIGLFPLALIVPLSRRMEDWASVLKGLVAGCAGIAVLALFAAITGAARWNFKVPSFIAARTLSNFFLTSIPEEGFYRGFIQNALCKTFENLRLGKILALIATSILFTAAHYFWSPNLEILAFVFLASLLYGGVYLISGKIESAMLTHFLLNFIHMTFFSYHAM
jgi:CAAX protease family protein